MARYIEGYEAGSLDRKATMEAELTALREAIEQAKLELGYIANTKWKSFLDAEEFREWAQNRAARALAKLEAAAKGE